MKKLYLFKATWKIISFSLLFKILLLLAGFSLNAQNIIVSGKVQDSLKIPLDYANILAVPESDSELRFAITKDNGDYQLKLEEDQTYKITVSYLGFLPQNITVKTTKENITKDFTLQVNHNQLDEITLNYTPPITVKKDTTIYRVDKFVTGEERKLKDVLKKLPGVEVDRAGNVTVQGKKVTKVLVEGKTFFTGNSKLAVNNIPADAVNEVEILDNYNDVAMLKGLQDSEDLAMNIKLKEDKKNFAFGDVEVGAGIKDRYVIHPNLFYYSPKTNVNLIGDLNNTGSKSFTFRDYLEFEGGFGKLMSDSGGYFNLFNSDFAQYLTSQDFKSNTNQFGALNIRQAINEVTDISGYVISSKAKIETQNNTINQYNFGEPFTENRTTTNNANTFFTIGKVTIDYDPTFKEDFAYNSFVKVTNNTSNGLINTNSINQNNTINTLTDIVGLNLKQNVSYSRKLSKKHTGTLEATYNYKNDEPLVNWLTNQEILPGLIPLQTDAVFNILQIKTVKTHNASAIVKDYWVVNNFNHLYTSLGVNAAFNSFENQDVQQLSNGEINNFNTADFGNVLKYNFIDTFVGLEYKFQTGITTFKPALYYHFYNWQVNQQDSQISKTKALALPQLTIKTEFNSSEKLNFKYKLNARFPTVNRLVNNFILSSFNSVSRGNPDLDNTLYHSASLTYYKFSLFKNLNLNLSTSFNKKVKDYKNVTQLDGINQFNTLILFEQPEHSWNVSGRIAKKIKKIKYQFRGSYRYRDFFQIVNTETNKNISKNVSGTISAETSFKKHPNIEIGYTKNFNNYRSSGSISKFENDAFFVNLEYDFLENFIFKADYNLDNYQNKSLNIKNTFDTANASLFYQVEDSAWGFEINATNLFNTQFKQDNSFSDFLISDSKTFILPRIIMFKVAYKL